MLLVASKQWTQFLYRRFTKGGGVGGVRQKQTFFSFTAYLDFSLTRAIDLRCNKNQTEQKGDQRGPWPAKKGPNWLDWAVAINKFYIFFTDQDQDLNSGPLQRCARYLSPGLPSPQLFAVLHCCPLIPSCWSRCSSSSLFSCSITVLNPWLQRPLPLESRRAGAWGVNQYQNRYLVQF